MRYDINNPDRYYFRQMNLSAFKRMTTETDGLPLALFAVQSGTLMPRTTASAA